jgi:hypothetical protein
MRKHAEKENGLHDLMEIMLESMMVAERSALPFATDTTHPPKASRPSEHLPWLSPKINRSRLPT